MRTSGYPINITGREHKFPVSLDHNAKTIYSMLSSVNNSLTFSFGGFAGAIISVNQYAVSSSSTLSVRASDNNIDFIALQATDITNAGQTAREAISIPLSNQTATRLYIPAAGKFFRLSAGSVTTAMIPVAITLTNEPLSSLYNPIDSKHVPSACWNYVALTGGITTTSLVTLAAGIQPTQRLGITWLSVYNAGAGTSEFVVQDNAGTPVELYRGFIGAAQGLIIPFDNPKFATANKSIQFKIDTATTMQVYVNAQGVKM